MKQKTDETPDQWVRETLRQLPDSPPPGSSFDPERLWTQLRPELQATPVRHRIGWGWWIAAACMAGLILGWFWLHQSISKQAEVAVHDSPRKAEIPTTPLPKQNRQDGLTLSTGQKWPLSIKTQATKGQKMTDKQGLTILRQQAQEPVSASIALVSSTPDPLVVAEEIPVIEKQIEPLKPTVATTTPNRRFRVVHENELRAEEESRPKLYPTENFVRLGNGRRQEATPDNVTPTLSFPLTHKPNQ